MRLDAHLRYPRLFAAVLAGALIAPGGALLAQSKARSTTRATPAPAARMTVDAGPVTPWPRPVPIRLQPRGRDDVMITTLGEVSTPLADGTFDPVADRVTTTD